MMLILRWMIRLGVLALAGYGAKELYEKYGSRATGLSAPSRDFVQRTKDAVSGTAERVTDATHDMTTEIRDAADDATDDAKRRLAGEPVAAAGNPS